MSTPNTLPIDRSIEAFIESKILPKYRPIFTLFRNLLKAEFPQILEEMRGGTEKYYGVPVYRLKKILITVSPTQKGITFSFSEGKKFEDVYQLLEGVGNKTLNWRISETGQYQDEIMRYYIHQALKYVDAKETTQG